MLLVEALREYPGSVQAHSDWLLLAIVVVFAGHAEHSNRPLMYSFSGQRKAFIVAWLTTHCPGTTRLRV